jgi:hypothetical protein
VRLRIGSCDLIHEIICLMVDGVLLSTEDEVGNVVGGYNKASVTNEYRLSRYI